MHQNNGIAFAPDGSLFVTSASAGNRTLGGHPWEGVVLRVSADFKQTEVFSQGFRNPFGILIGPDNEVFATDNDVDANPGDEINHVIREAHYGHPYVVPNEPEVVPVGFRDPIFVGGVESNLLGMAYTNSKHLPDDFRDRIYVTDFMQNEIRRLKLEKSGDTYKVVAEEPFATISSPIDVAASPSGELFVVSRNTRNIYRIGPRKATGRSSNG
jgi:glucose/arabinose dehydrogenase